MGNYLKLINKNMVGIKRVERAEVLFGGNYFYIPKCTNGYIP